jgi:hypothetical protein
MKHILQTFVALAVALLPAMAAQASDDNDFVARMMQRIEASPDTYAPSDYKQITVGPAMMRDVIQMLASTDAASDAVSAEDKQVVCELLRSIKSLRILVASDHTGAYRSLADKVTRDNKKIYKKYESSKRNDDKVAARVWTRQNGSKVVEIIALLDGGGKAGLRILDFTGSFNNDFITLLSKLAD